MYVSLVFRQGGAIGIVVDWTCNLDQKIKHCKPEYNFHGLYGNPSETDKARASVGYNFRCISSVFNQKSQVSKLQIHISGVDKIQENAHFYKSQPRVFLMLEQEVDKLNVKNGNRGKNQSGFVYGRYPAPNQKWKYLPNTLANLSNQKINLFVRYAKHYLEDKVQKRTLLKVFGIRIDIIVQSLVRNIHEDFRI